jgi:hypothetical protein
VVLHYCYNDVVTGLQVSSSVTLGDEINAFGRSAGKDDLSAGTGIEKPGDLLPRLVVGDCGPLAQVVDPAVDVGVFRGIESGERVDDHLRLLTGRRIIEVDEGLSPDPLAEDGEILPDAGDIERGSGAGALWAGGKPESAV